MSGARVKGLTVRIDGRAVIEDISFAVEAGEILAIVGESGAGKSIAVRCVLGMAPAGARVVADRLEIDGQDMTAASERAWRDVRGGRVGLVTQNALGALDPLRRVGAEVAEPLAIHTDERAGARAARAIAALGRAGVPAPAERARQFPHELSGGLRQRAVIASALVAEPAVLVADEPTTALDATVRVKVLAELRGIADAGRAVVLVSHDLAAVEGIADRIIVMRAGRIVEQGPAARVIHAPEADYTRELWAASAARGRERYARDGAVALSATGLSRRFGDRVAVSDVDITLRSGSVMGIVGESGSGKTTLARLLVGADRPDAGRVTLADPRGDHATARAGDPRRRVQFVAQNPYASFNPTWSIERSLGEALQRVGVPRRERRGRAAALLAEVGLDPALAARRPRQLSGGQLQRAAIARALAVEPQVLVLDEPLSALDVSVAARILDLLARLRDERGVAMALISHDLSVVAAIADRTMAMKDGVVVEAGDTHTLLTRPRHPFTRELVEASMLRW